LSTVALLKTLEDRLIWAKPIAEQLGISRERVGSIIPEVLEMRKLSVKWVPKSLKTEQELQSSLPSEQILEIFRVDLNDYLSRLATINETWLYHNDPETIQQYLKWRHSGSPRSKYFECKYPRESLSPQYFGIKTASSSLSIFQRATLTVRSITYLSWYN